VMLLVSPAVFAEKKNNKTPAVEDASEFSLAELLNIEVVTGTKSARKISEAPVIIGVYTGKEISSFGVDNLYELLSSLPGIEVMETYYGYTVIQFRGILQAHYNNKSSLLLNGQPLYDQMVSSYYLEQIPVSSIQRIEIVRGSGGVLYGTNAYAGVINIITKKGIDIDGALASIKMGRFNTKALRFVMGKEINGLDIFFAGEFNQSDGYKKTVTWDEDDVNPPDSLYGNSSGSRIMGYYPDDPNAYENDYTNFFTSLKYKDFTLNAIYFENEKDKFGIIPTLTSTGERKLQGYGMNLKYNHSLKEGKADFSAIVWYDRIQKNERVNAYPPVLRAPNHKDEQEYSGHKSGAQVEINAALTSKLTLLSGIGMEISKADPYYFFLTETLSERIQDEPANAIPEAQTTNDFWAFFQTEYKAGNHMSFLAGGRYNKNKQAGGVFIPSLGMVYSVNQNLSFKLLYAGGFRNPSFFEKYVRTVNILAGVESLEPEKINSFDLGMDLSLSNFNFRLNAFYAKTDKLIGRRGLTLSDTAALNLETGYGSGPMEWKQGAVYANGGSDDYYGLELSVQGNPVNQLNFRGNLSYKKGKDNQGNELLYFSPWLANVGVIYRPTKRISVSAVIKYVGKIKGHYASLYPWNQWPNAAAGGTDYSIDGYMLFNAGITFRLCPGIVLSLIGKNLFNKEYVYPEYIRQAIPYIPGGPGRAVYWSVSYKF